MKILIEEINNFMSYLQVERGCANGTIRVYSNDLSEFSVFIAKHFLDDVVKQDIRDFMNHLANCGKTKPNLPITRARKLSALKSFFKFLVREEKITVNPADGVDSPKIPTKEPNFLTETECEALLSTIKQRATNYYKIRDLTIFSLFLSTGIRLSELVNIIMDDVNTQDGFIKITRKGDRQQIIPLNDEMKVLLKKYIAKRKYPECLFIFVSKKANQMRPNTVYHLARKYLLLAGIGRDKVGVHTLRHTFCTNLLRQGVNVFTLQKLMGHKSLKTTERYAHINSADLKDAVNLIKLP